MGLEKMLHEKDIEKELNKLKTDKDKIVYFSKLNLKNLDIGAERLVEEEVYRIGKIGIAYKRSDIQKKAKEIWRKCDGVPHLLECADKIKEIHDKYHPEVVVVTQISAVGAGYDIKSAWKEAWPKEKVPYVITINVKKIRYEEDLKKKIEELNKELEKIKTKLKKIGRKGNIIVIDEGVMHTTVPREWMTGKYTFEPKFYHPIYDEPCTLFIATEVVSDAVRKLGYQSKVGAIEFFGPGTFISPWAEPSRTPWFFDKKVKYERGIIKRKKYSLELKEVIKNVKENGKKLGEIIKEEKREEHEKRHNTIEKIVTLLIIGVLTLGLSFYPSNLTGKAISNLDGMTSNIIGVVIFVIVLVVAFWYFKKK